MFPNYNGTCHWQQDSCPKTTSQKIAQIGNKGGNLMVDGDTGPYYVSCIIACSVSHYCLDFWLFLEIRMNKNGHLQNIETMKKYKFI